MPKTHVEKSITIAASADKVKSIITDFNKWKPWSPWFILEPETKESVSADGKSHKWDGKRIGSGIITIISESDTLIRYDLKFLKPWKSESKTDFILEKVDENTTYLTWTMDDSLPFFMFWMKSMMERLIGMDYDRGLLMLKEYIEKGHVDAKLEFLGESQFEGINFVGIKSECTIDTIDESMTKDFKKIAEFAKENEDIVTCDWFSVYHKFDFNKNQVIYTSGVGIKSEVLKIPARMFEGSIPATKIHTVRHIGPYELSGNGWSAIMAMERAKEFKQNKKIPPMEFYRNSPIKTEPKDLISDICMAVK
ncbi:MAG: SRPBCC family protein [Labilibaculum sp.]|nr:SRPBCC family protein [Labilibaculum sp.]MBI9058766.1 SRPBCC family protein [Labilibaculum sp.]